MRSGTGTHRPPSVTEPASVPCRTAARAASWRPFGPHRPTTSSSVSASIACGPAPTATTSNPSRGDSASSFIATWSGTVDAAEATFS